MKHSLFILFLAASPFIFAQEAINDSLQELPKAEQKAHRKAQLERYFVKNVGTRPRRPTRYF